MPILSSRRPSLVEQPASLTSMTICNHTPKGGETKSTLQKLGLMYSPKKKSVELSPRRYDLSPGGTIWKNPHLLEKTELSDFTFEPVLSVTTGGSSFSWDVSTHSSDEEREREKANVSTPQRRYMSTGAGSPYRHGASGSSFKTVSISKNTAATDNTSVDDDRATSLKKGSIGKPPSPSTTIPSNTNGTVFAFLENLFCCGFDTTDDPKQKNQKENDNDFLGKIITCHIITCNCEGCTNCVSNYPDNEEHPTTM
eukprot:scaffold4803_cov148-Skeletonema_menzelii.AAC.6